MGRQVKSKDIRQRWSKENMERAIMAVKNGDCSQKRAALTYDVPRQTLRRYLNSQEEFKKISLGRKSDLGDKVEIVLVNHIKTLSDHGFSLTRRHVRALAFELAESLKIKHRFKKELKLAGWDWLWGFLKRNPDLSIRKEENLSITRALSMTKDVVNKFYNLLEEKMLYLDLLNRADRIFNMDESGFQLNSRAQSVVAPKGKRVVHAIAPKEKGETVTIVACFNAAGNYFPPVLIIKGVRTIVGLKEKLPAGSQVFMNPQSAYINSDIFSQFIKSFVAYFHICQNNPAILILDGHESHCANPDVLDFAALNSLCILCLPPHTTEWLQPADRGLFAPLKKYFYDAASRFVRQYGRAFTKLEFSELVTDAWNKSAQVGLASNAFRATGLWPLNRDAIPNYAYNHDLPPTIENTEADPQLSTSRAPTTMYPSTQTTLATSSADLLEFQSSTEKTVPTKLHKATTPEKRPSASQAVTPRSTLEKLSPLPNLIRPSSTRGRPRGIARELTSNNCIQVARELKRKRDEKQKGNIDKNKPKSTNKEVKVKQVWNEDCFCPTCKGKFSDDTDGEEWIRCEDCQDWYHVHCVQINDLNFLCEKCLM